MAQHAAGAPDSGRPRSSPPPCSSVSAVMAAQQALARLLEAVHTRPVVATAAAVLGLAALKHCLTPSAVGRPLPVTVRETDSPVRAAGVSVVLLHGMWHGPWFYKGLQDLLASRGIASYAVGLQGEAANMTRTEAELVADLEATLDGLKLTNAVLLGHSQGGILTQCFLRDAAARRPKGELGGAVLFGTMPLGMTPPPALAFGLRDDGGYASMYCAIDAKIRTVSPTNFKFPDFFRQTVWLRQLTVLTHGSGSILSQPAAHGSYTKSGRSGSSASQRARLPACRRQQGI